jgi:hypothetical protein
LVYSLNTRLFREEAPPGDEKGARHATEGRRMWKGLSSDAEGRAIQDAL